MSQKKIFKPKGEKNVKNKIARKIYGTCTMKILTYMELKYQQKNRKKNGAQEILGR